MTTWLVNIAGSALIGFIIWWFWLSTPKATRALGQIVDILVANGVYTPSRIEISAGKPITLRFLRKDASPCAEKVVFDQLALVAELPLDVPRDLSVTVPTPGEYQFTCEMRMYRGTLVVK